MATCTGIWIEMNGFTSQPSEQFYTPLKFGVDKITEHHSYMWSWFITRCYTNGPPGRVRSCCYCGWMRRYPRLNISSFRKSVDYMYMYMRFPRTSKAT